MRTTKPAAILLALVLLTAAAAQSAKKPAKKEISITRTASCLVKITSDPAVLPLSDIVIDYLLHSSGVAGKAAREVLNISPDQASELFRIEDVAKYSTGGIPPTPLRRPRVTGKAPRDEEEIRRMMQDEEEMMQEEELMMIGRSRSSRRRPTTRPTTPAASPASTAEQTFLFELQVVLPDEVKPAAEEFMNALIKNLRRALSGAFDDYRNKIMGQQRLAAEEADRAENKLVQMQEQLRNISDYRNLSRSVILKNISIQRSNIQSTEMRKASDQIEMESIGKEIANTEVKIKDKVKNDPITIELQRIVGIHSKRSAQDDDVLEKLARARIEIAKRREEISKAQGGNRVSQLSSKLAQYTQRMAQYELSLSSTKDQLKEAMAFLDRADDYELLSLKADITRQSLEEALLWREQMNRKARLVQPPAVTVLGGS